MHIILDVQIKGRQYSALLDSGAQGNYISPQIINRDKIPWHQKEYPYRLSTVEGQEVAYGNGIIDRETDHLPVTVCGRTTIFSLDITDTAHHELILGLPWLRAKNPRIDWVTGQIYWDNAVPQKRTAINGEGRSSVTEDSPRRRRSNEPTHTSKKGRDIPFKRMEKDLATLRISPRDGSRSGQDRIGQRLPRSPPHHA